MKKKGGGLEDTLSNGLEKKADYYRRIEKEFLEDYVEFGFKTRALMLGLLKDACKNSVDDEARQYILYVLAFEQFMMQVETVEAFYRAARERNKRPVLATLEKDFNPGQLFQELSKKNEQELVAELVEGLMLEEDDKKGSDEQALRVVRVFRNKKFMEALQITKPFFNVIKHKFLVYRNSEGVPVFVIEPIKEQELRKKSDIGESILEKRSPCEEIASFYRMSQNIENAIRELASLLLLHKGDNGNDHSPAS